jgi:pyruvate/2-oxoglutarate dehydrogenase complex dihydrolipoamide dehydrogenase (E3) component
MCHIFRGGKFQLKSTRPGDEVTVIELADRIISHEDPEVSESLQDALEAEGINFHLGARTTKVARAPAGLEIAIEKKDGTAQTLKGSHLLVSIGQVPNSDDLGLLHCPSS